MAEADAAETDEGWASIPLADAPAGAILHLDLSEAAFRGESGSDAGDGALLPGTDPAPASATFPSAHMRKSADAALDPNAPGGALELVARQAAAGTPDEAGESADPAEGMNQCLAVGDFSGALARAEKLLAADPNHPTALATAAECREVLQKMHLSRLGGWKRIPEVAARSDQFRWLSMDHHAGFLLSLVDGRFSVEDLVDASGMPPFEALRILATLVDHGVIRIR